jgi:hypothetical protein
VERRADRLPKSANAHLPAKRRAAKRRAVWLLEERTTLEGSYMTNRIAWLSLFTMTDGLLLGDFLRAMDWHRPAPCCGPDMVVP